VLLDWVRALQGHWARVNTPVRETPSASGGFLWVVVALLAAACLAGAISGFGSSFSHRRRRDASTWRRRARWVGSRRISAAMTPRSSARKSGQERPAERHNPPPMSEGRTLTERRAEPGPARRQFAAPSARTHRSRRFLERNGDPPGPVCAVDVHRLFSRIEGFQRGQLDPGSREALRRQGTLNAGHDPPGSKADYWPIALGVRDARREPGSTRSYPQGLHRQADVGRCHPRCASGWERAR